MPARAGHRWFFQDPASRKCRLLRPDSGSKNLVCEEITVLPPSFFSFDGLSCTVHGRPRGTLIVNFLCWLLNLG